MSQGYIILLILLVMGFISNNALVTGASILLLLLKFADIEGAFPLILRYGLNIGLFLLILTVITPVADDRLGLKRLANELMSPSGIASLVLSAASSYLARYGIEYLKGNPETLVGLMVGTMLGTFLLGGIPTGPLIAAGATALLAHLLR